MRKLLLALTVIAAALSVDAAELLRVKLKNADPVEFQLSQEPEIAFAGDKLTISVPDSDGLSVELDDVECIEMAAASGIANAGAAGISVRADASAITFAGLPADAAVTVCDLAGRVVVDTRATDTFSLSRADYARGYYLVKINTFTAKIRL